MTRAKAGMVATTVLVAVSDNGEGAGVHVFLSFLGQVELRAGQF
jgi:hypothetical protein